MSRAGGARSWSNGGIGLRRASPSGAPQRGKLLRPSRSTVTGYPHTLTPGDTTTLKRRQGAHAPGTCLRYLSLATRVVAKIYRDRLFLSPADEALGTVIVRVAARRVRYRARIGRTIACVLGAWRAWGRPHNKLSQIVASPHGVATHAALTPLQSPLGRSCAVSVSRTHYVPACLTLSRKAACAGA